MKGGLLLGCRTRVRMLNDFILFPDCASAERFRSFYLTQSWAEIARWTMRSVTRRVLCLTAVTDLLEAGEPEQVIEAVTG